MDDGLKQRLIGAIVLAAIAVLFLPSLFKQDSRRAVDMTSQIPQEPAAAIELLEVPEPERPDNIPPAQSLEENYRHEVVESGSGESVPESEPAEADQADSGPDRRASDPEPEPPALNAEGVPQAWSLQVASFQSSDRAEALWQRLQEEGHASYIREADTAQGRLHRVFVGPKVSKAQVQAEKQSIDERFDTDALIVEFKP